MKEVRKDWNFHGDVAIQLERIASDVQLRFPFPSSVTVLLISGTIDDRLKKI